MNEGVRRLSYRHLCTAPAFRTGTTTVMFISTSVVYTGQTILRPLLISLKKGSEDTTSLGDRVDLPQEPNHRLPLVCPQCIQIHLPDVCVIAMAAQGEGLLSKAGT